MKMFRLVAIAAALLAVPAVAQQATLTKLPKVLDAAGNVQPTVGSVCIQVDGSTCPAVSGGGGSTPTGTAGSPNAAVVSVQGISGGTPQNVNNAQLSGATISTGTGTSGTGTQRVVLASDSPLAPGAASASNQATQITAEQAILANQTNGSQQLLGNQGFVDLNGALGANSTANGIFRTAPAWANSYGVYAVSTAPFTLNIIRAVDPGANYTALTIAATLVGSGQYRAELSIPIRGSTGTSTYGPQVSTGPTAAASITVAAAFSAGDALPIGDGAASFVIQKGAANLTSVQVSVGTSATLVSAVRPGRSRLVLTQSAAGPCYYGPTNAVSATTGSRLAAAGASKAYTYTGALYGICPGGAVTTDVDEEF